MKIIDENTVITITNVSTIESKDAFDCNLFTQFFTSR